jgi:hypothetical protein
MVVACKNGTPNMTTGINADGSCYREFTAQVSSQFLTQRKEGIKINSFPVHIDSTWKIAWKIGNSAWVTQYPVKQHVIDSVLKTIQYKDTARVADSRIFTMLLHKDFQSVADMSSKFRFDTAFSWHRMHIKQSLSKKFRWFYTYYTYKEVFPKVEHQFTVPIENYMSKNEASFWFTGKPDLLQGMNGIEIREYAGQLEDKYNEWFTYNLWIKAYKVLINNYDRFGNIPVSKQRLINLQDTIYDKQVKGKDDVDMEKALNSYFKTKAFSRLWASESSPMKQFEKAFADQNHIDLFMESIHYRLVMPGKTTKSNSSITQGDTLCWNLTAFRMVPSDYVIEATSAKANVWAFIVTGVILLISIGSYFWRPRRRNR